MPHTLNLKVRLEVKDEKPLGRARKRVLVRTVAEAIGTIMRGINSDGYGIRKSTVSLTQRPRKPKPMPPGVMNMVEVKQLEELLTRFMGLSFVTVHHLENDVKRVLELIQSVRR